jgi:hypothetical protein
MRFKSLRRLLALGLLSLHGIGAHAQVSVEVAEVFQIIDEHVFSVPSNTLVTVPITLGELRSGDKVVVTLNSPGRAKSFVADLVPMPQLADYVAKRQRIFNDLDRGRALPVPVGSQWTISQSAEHAIVFAGDSWWLGEAEVRLRVTAERTLAPQEHTALVGQAQELAAFVGSVFGVRPFRIRVKPCGEVNAVTWTNSGDIELCTELLHDLRASRGGFLGVFFHELGHSLLKQWELPGWDQEDIADDFAIYMLLQLPGGIGMAADYAAFFAQADPTTEGYRVASLGGRHSSGLQRYQNIQQRLRDPEGFMGEWNRLLYPRMSTEHLRQIVRGPRLFESAALAQAALVGRP